MAISDGPISSAPIASSSQSNVDIPVPDELVREVFAITESTTETVRVFVRPDPILESMIIRGDALPPTASGSLLDTFTITDNTTTNVYHVLRDSFLVDDVLTPVSTIRVTVRSSMVASDTVVGYQTDRGSLLDEFVALGGTTSIVIGVVEREAFSVSDSMLVQQRSSRTVREKFLAVGKARPRRSHTEREGFTARGQHAQINLRGILLRETFFVQGRDVLISIGGSVRVRDHFAAFGRAQPFSTVRTALLDRFNVFSRMFSPASTAPPASIEAAVPISGTQLWTADMRGWGMSRYVGVPVIDFAGAQYGVGGGGLYTYDPGSVMAFWETGDMSLLDGEERILLKHRLNYAYIYGTTSAAMSVRVTADVNNQRESHTYDDVPRTTTDSRAMRIPLGRGFTSNYARLRIGGVATFDVANLELETTVSGRRV